MTKPNWSAADEQPTGEDRGSTEGWFGSAAGGLRLVRTHAWFIAAIVVSVLVADVYLRTHQYPAYGAGLYLQIAEEMVKSGYGLPANIPLYTDGVPFAYPPLLFYVAALARDLTGVGPYQYSLWVPSAVTVLYLFPYYGIASALLPTRRQAGLATLLLAVTPPVLRWHLSAGGIVRGPAFLLALTGIYAGVRLFKYGHLRWVPVGTVLFGLTILSHPVYTAFFGLSWLLLFCFLDRSVRGLVAGAAVAAGGLALAAPWWVQIAQRHGPNIFFAAAGTHNGLAGGPWRLVTELVYPIDATLVSVPFVAALGAGAWFLKERRFLLPTWLVAGAYVIGKPRFQFVAGSMMVAAALCEAVVPQVRRRSSDRIARTALGLAVVVAVGIGALYAGGMLPQAHNGSPSTPAFLDSSDEEAMTWAAANTEPDAAFVVLGDAAEWFPLRTDRAILVGPWGVEWTSPAEYEHQLSLYRDASACDTADCLTATLAGNASPDYVYVPKGEYTVRGYEETQSPSMRPSLVATDRYELVYENEGAMIFRVRETADEGDRVSAPDTGVE